MAKIYSHKKRGYQVRFTVYLPDGTHRTKYRYSAKRSEAEAVLYKCEFIERGSRAGNLSSREIIQAQHDGFISDEDARMLSGGKAVNLYDIDKVFDCYQKTVAVSHRHYALVMALCRANHLKSWLMRHPIPSLVVSDVNNYILGRLNGSIIHRDKRTGYAKIGVKPKTVKNELEVMIGLIDEAVKLGMVETNVARSAKIPFKSSKLRRSCKRDEIASLLKAADENRHLLFGQAYELIMIALYTGLRRSELRTLCWDEDVNLEAMRIFVQAKQIDGEDDFIPKSGEDRSCTIPDRLTPIFNSIERKGRFVFGGEKPYPAKSITIAVKKIIQRAGLPDSISLHNLRHTYGSWLLRKTGNLKFVQEAMGHLDIETTMNYMHNIEDINDPIRTFDYD